MGVDIGQGSAPNRNHYIYIEVITFKSAAKYCHLTFRPIGYIIDKMKNYFQLLIFVIFLSLVSPKLSFADGTNTRCETQYCGTQICVSTGQLQINKEVLDPITNQYVDNLGINNHKFTPGEVATFRISVKNIGDATLSKVTVTDSPQSEFLSLAGGNLNFELKDLKPGEIRSTEVKLKVTDGSKMPQNNVICVINTAEAVSDSNKDKDSAQLCLERKAAVPVVTKTPATGAHDWIFAIFGGASSFAGIRLMRFGKYSPRGEAMTNHEEVENMINKKVRG